MELLEMTKPEISELKHQNMLEKAIVKAKDKSVLSWWWLSIPLYVIVVLIMKVHYTSKTSVILTIQSFMNKQNYTAVLFFLVLPSLLIVINALSIKHLYFLYRNLSKVGFIKTIIIQFLIILISLSVILIYFI